MKQGGEDFLPIGSDEAEPPLPGEIALDELAALLSEYVGAEVINKQIVNREKKEVILEE